MFRRFDDVIQYHLLKADDIISIIKKYLLAFSIVKKPNYSSIAEMTEGLNYSNIVKACEDDIKKMIMMEQTKIDIQDLIYGIEKGNKIVFKIVNWVL